MWSVKKEAIGMNRYVKSALIGAAAGTILGMGIPTVVENCRNYAQARNYLTSPHVASAASKEEFGERVWRQTYVDNTIDEWCARTNPIFRPGFRIAHALHHVHDAY